MLNCDTQNGHYSFFSAGASPSFFSAGASPSFFSAEASPSFFSAAASPSFFSPPASPAGAAPPGGALFSIIFFMSSMALVFAASLSPLGAAPPPPPPSPQPIANASKPHPSNIANFFMSVPLLVEVLRTPTRRRPAIVFWSLRDGHKIHSLPEKFPAWTRLFVSLVLRRHEAQPAKPPELAIQRRQIANRSVRANQENLPAWGKCQDRMAEVTCGRKCESEPPASLAESEKFLRSALFLLNFANRTGRKL